MKNELMQVWYRVTFMVTDFTESDTGIRREYSTFCQASSEISAAVSAALGLERGDKPFSHSTFKSIRIATYGESDSIEAELDAIAEREAKELEEEGDE